MPICQFSFSIKQWKIVCDKSLSEADWLKGSAHWLANRENFEDFTPKLAFTCIKTSPFESFGAFVF